MSSGALLSPMQTRVWSLFTKGRPLHDIAKQLKTSPQYVYQTRRTAEAKITNALLKTAEASHITVHKLRAREGLLFGYHPALQQYAFISYATRSGIRIWYWHDHPETITDTGFLNEVRDYLLDLAEERNLTLSDADTRLHPAKLANEIFRRLMPEVSI